jgi:hypothetical protein
MRVASFILSSRVCVSLALTFRLSLPELPRHPKNCYGWYRPEESKQGPAFIAGGGIAMTRLVVWTAALSMSALSAGAVHAQSFTLNSPDLKDGGTIANEQVITGFGCTGGNISPALSWSGAPAGTKSFAINMLDPDAPTGSGWWHWVVFNIPASTTSLPKDVGNLKKGKLMPKGAIQSRTDFGTPGYGGPCPPAGDKPHHYQITVFAVDVDKLPIARDSKASAASVGFDLHFHTLAKATLTGLFGH